MQLTTNEIHIWSTNLTMTPASEKDWLPLLSSDEHQRAMRFIFPIHQQRFIAARSILRQILSLYLNIAPQAIIFAYTEYHKPYIRDYPEIRFNLAHSHEMAVYALTLHHAIGIDIEKIKPTYKSAVAKRYFSREENRELMQLSNEERVLGFYQLWSKKEAIVKAVGKGLSIPLSSFSVSIRKEFEIIELENASWSLLSLPIHPDYSSALASNQSVKSVLYWQFFDHGIQFDKTHHL